MNTLCLALPGVSLRIALGLVAGLYAGRWGLSHLLAFLALGMLAGVDGPLGLPWLHGLLPGAVLSPTDAAAVFNRLSSSGVQLPPRLSATLAVVSLLVQGPSLGWVARRLGLDSALPP